MITQGQITMLALMKAGGFKPELIHNQVEAISKTIEPQPIKKDDSSLRLTILLMVTRLRNYRGTGSELQDW